MSRTALIVAALLIGSDALGQAARRSPVRTIENGGAVAARRKQAPRCQAFAPEGWRVVGGREAGDLMELASGDGRMYAGWGIRGVNRAMEGVYGALYGAPETSSLAVVAATLQAMGSRGEPRYSGNAQSLGAGFVARYFQSATHKGVVVFRVYPPPAGFAPGSYIISLRIAVSERQKWEGDGQRLAVGVAASINCSTMLTRSRGGDVEIPRPGDPPGMRTRDGETDDLADYNAQLGTQWVHSPSTGEKYMVDADAAWSENGPDGPGFYRQMGNTYEKLTPGFGQ